MIKGNKPTEENPAKPKVQPGWSRVVRPPLWRLDCAHLEILAVGQPATSHRLISQFTPRIAAKLQG
jgi:hypothetical protein